MTRTLDASLGRLGAPPTGASFDDVRIAMLDVLIAGRVMDEATHAPWQAAWDAAGAGLRDHVLREARQAIHDAARRSRFPARRLQALEPDDESADILMQRILAEGMPLEQLEREPADAGRDRARVAALSQAWDGGVRVAATEVARWRGVAQQVATWRPAMRTYWTVSALLVAAATVVACWLGGQLPAPDWFRPLHEWWWSLPWP